MQFIIYINPQTQKIWCINADATVVVYGDFSGLYTRSLRVSSFEEITHRKIAAGFYRLDTLTVTGVIIPRIWTIYALYFCGVTRVIEAQKPEDFLPVFKQVREWDLWPTSAAMVEAVKVWFNAIVTPTLILAGKRCYF